jgi:hypothetical protein
VTVIAIAELAKGAASNNNVTPGVLGFLIVAGMGLALVLLLRSMNRQFRKIPPSPEEPDGAQAAAPGRPAQAAPAGRSRGAGTAKENAGPDRAR